MGEKSLKTILFHGINTPGHVNFLLALADKLKEEERYRIVFLLLGSAVDKTIEKHGHELIVLEEKSAIEVDEINDDEDSFDQNDAKDSSIKCDRRRIKLSGYAKYEHFLRSKMSLFSLDPLAAFAETMSSFRSMIENEVIENHESFAAAINSIKPDLMIIDVFMVPPSISGQNDIPWVKCCSANPLSATVANQSLGVRPPPMTGFKLFDKETRTKMRQEQPEEWEAVIESWRSAASKGMDVMMNKCADSPLTKFYQDLGLPPAPMFGHNSPYINLYLYPKEIDYDQDDDILEYPPRWFRCDSFIREPTDRSDPDTSRYWSDKIEDGMKGRKEMVYFSLGSLASASYKVMQKYVEILAKDQDRLYVISKGPKGDKYELDPSNMIGGNYIPQTFFLKRANLAIIHGGNNSLFECMYFGLPMIVIPVFADQHDNAQRVEDYGLGRRLKFDGCNEEQLIGTINEVLSDEAIIQKARSIGEQMRNRPTSSKVTKILKKLIDDKHLDEDFIELCKIKDINEIQF